MPVPETQEVTVETLPLMNYLINEDQLEEEENVNQPEVQVLNQPENDIGVGVGRSAFALRRTAADPKGLTRDIEISATYKPNNPELTNGNFSEQQDASKDF